MGCRTDLRAGWGVVWHSGEEHEVGSDAGLTAVCIEGNFETWAYQVTRDISVVDYDPRWPESFDRIRSYVWDSVADVALRIDHVGSTSVPGLAAKPVIDMDIVVASESDTAAVIERLRTIGYRWRGDLGVEGRQAFSQARTGGAAQLPEHHLYLVVEDNKAHLDHWLLRDLLRSDAEARSRYAALKRHNAARADRNMDTYVAAKAELVAELLARARSERGYEPATYWQPTRS